MSATGSLERKIYHYLFLFLVLLALIPLWWYPGFITADGPCHVYNAAVLKDFVTGDAAFYKEFYTVNTQLEPNWLSHIVLAGLMFIFNPILADKILITICVLNLAFGFRYFVTSLRGDNHYLAICVFPFLWQFAMFMGFYNYMLSIGSMFWITGYWYVNRGKLTAKQVTILALICAGLFFMHLLGIFLSAAIMGLITLSTYKKGEAKSTTRQLVLLALIMLPAALLSFNYILHNTSSFSNEYKQSFEQLWNNLKDIFSLQSIHTEEYRLSIIIAKVVAGYFIIAVLLLVTRKRQDRLWVMPVTILVILISSYFFAYESMLGGSYIRYRLECLIYMFALVMVALVALPVYLRISLAGFFAVMTLVYFGIRWQAFKDIDIMVGEFHSLRPHIKDKSVILPLKYVDFPKDYRGENNMASRVLLFSHVGETLYLDGKQCIFLENYEANTGYFPLLWKEKVNPFVHLGRAIEAAPPNVDIQKYNVRNHRIEHIVIWGRQGDIMENPLTQSVSDTINKYYDLVYTTPLYTVELYTLKDDRITE
jgi:hypothetical protein